MRKNIRHIRLNVQIVPDKQEMATHFTENMSAGGMFIRTKDILPVNTSMVMKFRLPDRKIIITCKAKVAWTNEPDDLKKYSLPPGMGVQFTDLSLINHQIIEDFLKLV
jgi:uncharacterized protein (TIGR02266 family)